MSFGGAHGRRASQQSDFAISRSNSLELSFSSPSSANTTMLQTPPDSSSPTIPRFRLPPDPDYTKSSLVCAPSDNDACRYQLPSLSFSPPAIASELWGTSWSARSFEEPYNALSGGNFTSSAHIWRDSPLLHQSDDKWGPPAGTLPRPSQQPLEYIYAARNQLMYNAFYNPNFAIGSAHNKSNYSQKEPPSGPAALAPSRASFMRSNTVNESRQGFASGVSSQFIHSNSAPPLAYPHTGSFSASRANPYASLEPTSLALPKSPSSTLDATSRAQPRSDEVSAYEYVRLGATS